MALNTLSYITHLFQTGEGCVKDIAQDKRTVFIFGHYLVNKPQ